MGSYYHHPPSTPFAGANYSPRTDIYQRPPPAVLENIQANPPDFYPISPVTVASTSPAILKNPGWSPPPAPVLKSPKTFLQWKADAKAATADYQHNGYPSPVAWVISSCIALILVGSCVCCVGLR